MLIHLEKDPMRASAASARLSAADSLVSKAEMLASASSARALVAASSASEASSAWRSSFMQLAERRYLPREAGIEAGVKCAALCKGRF